MLHLNKLKISKAKIMTFGNFVSASKHQKEKERKYLKNTKLKCQYKIKGIN